ncbi:LuxR C-terminal-related transcriptional regulator [Corynebacterium breve]|uniref:LuxR C-terminal-related transcriptional regulator n=1 Tax=Corynebacterium breve TaxID=3049799 RepID=A0ABY8VDZ9_9CORY|nr:LuxR C-terminal-related transcriptional regulator [Corynebacterium breve]WIM67901.1 LuxR C-terminal-related transcriptional regulator [Corynebacterium breve]
MRNWEGPGMGWISEPSLAKEFDLDPEVLNAVIDRVAQKLHAKLATGQLFFTRLPKEYLAAQILVRAMSTLDPQNEPRCFNFDTRRDAESLRIEFAGPLVIDVTGPLNRCSSDSREENANRLRSRKSKTVLALQTNDLSIAESYVVRADNVFTDSDLLLSLTDLEELSGEGVVVEKLLDETGGVPGFVVAALTDHARGKARAFPAMARSWAREIVPLVTNNLALDAMVWLPPIAEYSLRTIVNQVAPDGLGEMQLVSALASPAVVAAGTFPPAYPWQLKAALQELSLYDDAFCPLHDYVSLANSDLVPFPDRICALAAEQWWEELDALIRTRPCWLILVPVSVRRRLVALFPAAIPTSLTGLDTAKRFFAGELTQEHVSGKNPMWAELIDLVPGTERVRRQAFASPGFEPVSDVARELNEFIMRFTVTGPRVETPLHDPDSAVEFLDLCRTLITEHIRKVTEAREPEILDDTAMLIVLLNTQADLAIDLGLISIADDCSFQAQLLLGRLGGASDAYAPLYANVLAVRAFVSGMVGNNQAAAGFIERYRDLSGPTIPELDSMVDLAELLRLDEECIRKTIPLHVEIESIHAATEAFCQGVRVASGYGQDAAISYWRSIHDRVEWSAAATWRMWPVRAALVSLYGVNGQPKEARAWLDAGWLPQPLQRLAEIIIDLQVQPEQSLEELEKILGEFNLPTRWRMIALGYKIECLILMGTGEGEIAVAVRGENWAEHIGLSSILPENARQRIVEHYGFDVSEFPGLQPHTGQSVEELSERQLQILELLATGKLQREAADELGISTETVKATSKKIYRKLHVGNLQEAVRVARAQGWLQ